MSTLIAAVGRLKEKPYRQMADEYLKRLGRFGRVEEAEVPDLAEPENSSPALEEQIKTREGAALLARITPRDYVIALTVGGPRPGSEELARKIAGLRARGAGRLVFVIGGSLGLGANVLERADEELSMSPMTFPHQLARVMLLEQLYRAEKINAGERYHK